MSGPLLFGRRALVTGAGRGLGAAIAGALAEHGAEVAVADLASEDAQRVAKQLEERGTRAVGIEFDQGMRESVDRMVAQATEALGPIDILVNNAALFSALERKEFLSVTDEEWERVLQVNLTGVFRCMAAIVPSMVEQGRGKIVNIASASVFSARNSLPHYVAAKAGVIGLARAAARDLGRHGIQVNSVSPGALDSGADISTKGYLEEAARLRSIPRVEVPDDVVGTVVFLASSLSDFVTGQHLVVDGGNVFN